MKISKNKYIILDRDGTLIEEKLSHDPDHVTYRELRIKNLLQQDINLLCLQINRGSDEVISKSQICLVNDRLSLSFQEGIENKVYYCPPKPEEDAGAESPGWVWYTMHVRNLIKFEDRLCWRQKSDVELADNIKIKSVLVMTGYGRTSIKEGVLLLTLPRSRSGCRFDNQ